MQRFDAAFALLITAAMLAAALYIRSEASFRIVGGLFQLLGVVLVFVGIRRTLRRLGIGLNEIARQLGIPLKRKPVTIDVHIHEQADIVAAQGSVEPAAHHDRRVVSLAGRQARQGAGGG